MCHMLSINNMILGVTIIVFYVWKILKNFKKCGHFKKHVTVISILYKRLYKNCLKKSWNKKQQDPWFNLRALSIQIICPRCAVKLRITTAFEAFVFQIPLITN